MKKIITLLFVLTIFASFTSQPKLSFYVYKADVDQSSIKAYVNPITGAVDSTTAYARCWFAVVGNTYTQGENDFTKFNLLPMTIQGDARVSDFLLKAKEVAEAYKTQHYPNID